MVDREERWKERTKGAYAAGKHAVSKQMVFDTYLGRLFALRETRRRLQEELDRLEIPKHHQLFHLTYEEERQLYTWRTVAVRTSEHHGLRQNQPVGSEPNARPTLG